MLSHWCLQACAGSTMLQLSMNNRAGCNQALHTSYLVARCRAKSTFASFDWQYAPTSLYSLFWKCRSSRFSHPLPYSWASEVSTMIRAGLSCISGVSRAQQQCTKSGRQLQSSAALGCCTCLRIRGNRHWVSLKWPKWLVQSWLSNPWSVRFSGPILWPVHVFQQRSFGLVSEKAWRASWSSLSTPAFSIK